MRTAVKMLDDFTKLETVGKLKAFVCKCSLPTVRGMRCFKPSKNRFIRKVRKLLV